MLTPKGLQVEIDALASALYGDIDGEGASRLQGKICSLVQSLDEAITRARPMLLLTFDDTEGDPAFVCNPALNLRFGGELERCSWIEESALELPPVCRTLGEDATACCQALFRLSRIVRDAGFDSLVDIPSMSPGDFRAVITEDSEASFTT